MNERVINKLIEGTSFGVKRQKMVAKLKKLEAELYLVEEMNPQDFYDKEYAKEERMLKKLEAKAFVGKRIYAKELYKFRERETMINDYFDIEPEFFHIAHLETLVLRIDSIKTTIAAENRMIEIMVELGVIDKSKIDNVISAVSKGKVKK